MKKQNRKLKNKIAKNVKGQKEVTIKNEAGGITLLH